MRSVRKNTSVFFGAPFLVVLLLGISPAIWSATWVTSIADDPLSRLSPDEREVLAKAEGPHGQVRAYVRLCSERLRRAHEALERDDSASSDDSMLVYDAMLTELERVAREIPPRDKTNKMLEHALYEQFKSLEAIRRETSALHLEPVNRGLELVERVRNQTLNKILADGKLILREEGASKQP